MCRNTRHFYCSGFTLIEIIVTIVVLSIASTALLSVFTSTVSTSANPMIQQQAIAIAEAYMEEILLKDFSDPQGGELGTAESGETRASYDDVQDYNSLAPGAAPTDQNNGSIGVTGYSVTISVVMPSSTAEELNGIPAADTRRIDISVNHPAIDPINLSGYRTNY